jgi:hypothetical protein
MRRWCNFKKIGEGPPRRGGPFHFSREISSSPEGHGSLSLLRFWWTHLLVAVAGGLCGVCGIGRGTQPVMSPRASYIFVRAELACKENLSWIAALPLSGTVA